MAIALWARPALAWSHLGPGTIPWSQLEPLGPASEPPDDVASPTLPSSDVPASGSLAPVVEGEAATWWDAAARLHALDRQAGNLEKDVRYARQAALDVPLVRVEDDIRLARLYLGRASIYRSAGQDLRSTRFWADLAAFSLADGDRLLTPSRPVEARGILIDADALPKTPQGAIALVDRLADVHFNILLPEVIRRGYAIYPSAYLQRDPDFATAPDVLPALIEEAHRRGLEVLPWVWTFRVRSYDDRHDYGNPVLSRLPGLAARAEGTRKPRFMSPANPLARRLVHDELAELLDRYDVDGLFLDYIRYDEETPDDWTSRTDFAFSLKDPRQRQEFEDLERGAVEATGSAALARDYQLWRESQVDRTVEMVHELLKSRPRPLDLGVATFRSEWWSRQTKLQDWRNWADNEWTTFTTEMLYSDDAARIGGWIDQETADDRQPTLLYPILGVFAMPHPHRDLLAQIRAVRAHGQAGVFLFSLSHMNASLLDELARGPFRRPALIPQRDPLASAREVLADMADRYLPRQDPSGDWGTVGSARTLRLAIGSILHGWPVPGRPFHAYGSLEDRLRGLGDGVRAMGCANASFVAEVESRLRLAADLVRAYGHRLDTTRYVPPQPPPLISFDRELEKRTWPAPGRLAVQNRASSSPFSFTALAAPSARSAATILFPARTRQVAREPVTVRADLEESSRRVSPR